MRRPRFVCLVLAALVLPAFLSAGSRAEDYPARAITLIVPFTPASGIDIIARTVAPKVSERWHQPVVVENKPGASGGIGAQLVAKAEPNGYTLLVTGPPFAVLPALSKKPPYDVGKDFTPIAETATGSLALVVSPKALPVTSLKELIAAAKAKPGKLNYSSPGPGTLQHLGMELLKQELGLDVVHVAYHGASTALTDLVAGQIEFAYLPVHSAMPFANSGQLRILAVTSPQRSKLAPDVPSFNELGYPNMNFSLWYGMFGPPGLPRAIVDKWNRELPGIIGASDTTAPWSKQGLEPLYEPPAALAKLVSGEVARWHAVAQKAGVSME